MRCDSTSYIKGNGGCVFNSFTAAFKESRSLQSVGASARFIERAQNSLKGHPGVRPNALTRQFPVPGNAHRFAALHS